MSELNIDTVYYLWQLAGGDLDGILKRAGLIRTHPPITHLARYDCITKKIIFIIEIGNPITHLIHTLWTNV